MHVIWAGYPQEFPFQITRLVSHENGDLIGSNRFLLVAENLGRYPDRFSSPFAPPTYRVGMRVTKENGLVHENNICAGDVMSYITGCGERLIDDILQER